MRSEDEALELIQSTEAVLEGHFVLVSGLHSGRFVSKDLAGTFPHKLSQLVRLISQRFLDKRVELVAAPAIGAIALGFKVAEDLGPNVRFVYAEAEGDRYEFRRRFAQFIRPGTRVLVIEDIITTGKTVRAMIQAVRDLGGEVVGIGLLWNRSEEEFGVPVYACVTHVFPNYQKEDCPLCKACVPIDTTANKHGQEFLDHYGTDPAGWPANR